MKWLFGSSHYLKLMAVFFVFAACAGGFPVLPAAAQDQADELYQYYCAQCHGEKGDGKGVNATEDLPTQPKDFTSPKNLPVFTDEQIVNTVRQGGPKEQLSFIMPPWGDILSDGEIEILKKQLRKICQCQYDPVAAAAAAEEAAKQKQ